MASLNTIAVPKAAGNACRGPNSPRQSLELRSQHRTQLARQGHACKPTGSGRRTVPGRRRPDAATALTCGQSAWRRRNAGISR